MPVAMKIQPAPTSEILTLEEAAAYLKISAGTLKHWVAWKRIEHIKLGKLTRFRRSTLDRYLDRGTVKEATD